MAPLPWNLVKNIAPLRGTDEASRMPCLQTYKNNEDETRIFRWLISHGFVSTLNAFSPLLCICESQFWIGSSIGLREPFCTFAFYT